MRPRLALGLAAAAAARSILDFPLEVRRRNIVRLSRLECGECVTLEAFYEANPLVFVLLHERALRGVNQYKESVVAGFRAACDELRWSRVACGIVDMVDDREYAERYIDPKTAPAHIAVRGGEPVANPPHVIKRLMKRPGDKETILWHLREVLASGERGVLKVSSEVADEEALARLLQRREVVVAGFVGADAGACEAFRAAAQGLALRGGEAEITALLPAENVPPHGRKGAKRWRRARERARVAFVAVRTASVAAAHGLSMGVATAFVGAQPLPGATADLQSLDSGAGGAAATGAALEAVLAEAVLRPALARAAGRSAAAAVAGGADGGSPEKREL